MEIVSRKKIGEWDSRIAKNEASTEVAGEWCGGQSLVCGGVQAERGMGCWVRLIRLKGAGLGREMAWQRRSVILKAIGPAHRTTSHERHKTVVKGRKLVKDWSIHGRGPCKGKGND